MKDQILYGGARIAEAFGISERTVWRYVAHPWNDFLQVCSVGNAGGGQGRALMTYMSSFQAFKARIDDETLRKRSAAASVRWQLTDTSGGSGARAI